MQRFKTKLLNATDKRANLGSGLCLRCHDDSSACVPYFSLDYISLRRHALPFLYLSVFLPPPKLDKLSRAKAEAESRRGTSEEVSATISPRVPRQE